jgi:hypothetical protein
MFEFYKRKFSRPLGFSRVYVFFISGFIEQSKNNNILDLWGEAPFSLLVNFLFIFLIFYYFISKKKFSFYTIFHSLFTVLLSKSLGGKFISNYLFFPTNLRFFYFLFLYVCLKNAIADLAAIIPLWSVPANVLFIFFVAAFTAGIVKSNFQFPRTIIPFNVPVSTVSFLVTLEFV